MSRYVIANPQTCIGCRSCEIACVITHNGGHYPETRDKFRPRIKVTKIGENYTALACRHCDDAPCVRVCHSGAMIRRGRDVQLIEEKCTGCKNCILVCPYGAIDMVPVDSHDEDSTWIAHKCDLCVGHADAPACISVCPTGALVLYDEAQHKPVQWKETPAVVTAPQPEKHAYLKPAGGQDLKSSLLTEILVNNPRGEAQKKPLDVRKKEFVEIYRDFSPEQLHAQAERCLACSSDPSCKWTCPLHNNIPDWIRLAREGSIIEAVELLHQTSSLPEVCGRVCPQERLCEGACTLNGIAPASSVTIGGIERYIADTALEMGWRPDLSHVQSTGWRVAIVGAGPSGLACADVLARHGVEACVFDSRPEIGGMLTFGIPSFKLDKKVMQRRHQIFTGMGIKFHMNTEVGRDISFTDLVQQFDAVFIGVGTYQSIHTGLENEKAAGVYEALPFLIANTRHVMGIAPPANEKYISMEGKRVVVLGGGDTAMDCLRTSVRQGAAHVVCAYRRDEANMPGSRKELKNAREEGVEFMFNMQPVKIEVDENNQVLGVRMLRTELGEPDATGRRRPRPVPGSEFLLEADAIIVAFGFQPHRLGWLSSAGIDISKYGTITALPVTGSQLLACQTNVKKIFAGGDVVRGADLVVTAIADGRRAAQSIVTWLQAKQEQAA